MSHFLNSGQCALLQQLLQMRLHELERRAAQRVVCGDTARRSQDQALEFARSGHERTETAAVRDALARVHDATFGQCADCGSAIAFDRLKLEPWALRCVACEAALEQRSDVVIPRSTI